MSIEPIPEARVVSGVERATLIGNLTELLDEACATLGLDVMVRDPGPTEHQPATVGLAAWLIVVANLGRQSTVEKWVSLVEPGDIIGGMVVVRTRSRIAARSGIGVDLVLASPRATRSLDDPRWADEHVQHFDDPYEIVDVREAVWPVNW